MSEKKQSKENTEQKEKKVVTKYDLKMQRRKEEKEREQRQQRINNVIGIVLVVALVCLVASFPIRTYLATHETYVRINGEDVTKVEFDYNYNLAKTNYLNEYGYSLSYFGFDTTADPATVMYSETWTWKDYYESLAVDTMTQNKALMAQAKAEGFTYDTSEEYAEFETSLKEAAAAYNLSEKKYIQEQYGIYATKSRIKKYIEESIFLNAYYKHLTEVKAPTDEEIEVYYQENSDIYDSVDYRMSVIFAELPTEPTELADVTVSGNDAGATVSGGDADYEPSQAEIDKAMADAKEKAEAAEETIAKDGEAYKGHRMSTADANISTWLFDSSRKAGDTTIIENVQGNFYYVVAFESRYRNENLPANVRALITTTMDGQTILDEWNSGEATEESFAELCRKYSEDSTAEDGGLYEGLMGTDMDQELSGWIFDESRKHGDVTSIVDDYGETYVIYYVGIGEGDAKWKQDARNSLLNQIMNDYIAEIKATVTIEDPNGKLNYLKVPKRSESSEGEGAEDTSAGADDTSKTDAGEESQAATKEQTEGTAQ